MASFSQFQPRRTHKFQPRPVRAPLPAMPTPTLPPAAIVDAVLRFHDVAVDQGECTLLRLSEHRLGHPEVKAALGADVGRAARVAVLWNERESEIVRVFETQLAA